MGEKGKTGAWEQIGIGVGTSVLSDVLGGALGGLFTNKKKMMQRALEAQKLLNEQAAELNYQYGEKAAQNAYNRQMQMYERSYKDQSYGAMRQQMENAGLNVGLMYGGSASGGGSGSMSGAPQGQTGGAIAGEASSILSMEIAARQLKLQEAATMAQNIKTYAEAAEIKSRKEKNEAETGKTGAEQKQIETATQQAKESFEWVLENLKEGAKGTWLDNAAKQFNMEVDNFDEKKTISSEKFGDLTIKARGIFNQQTISKAIEAAAKKDDVEGANMLRAVEAAYQSEKTRWVATEVFTAVRLANVAETNANTERLKVKIQEYLAKSQVKLNDATITRIAHATILQAKGLELEATKAWAEIEALKETTEFNTGGWAKAKIVLQGIGAMGGIAADVATKGGYSKAKAVQKGLERDFDQPW